MEVVKCKRCNRKLTAVKSIERGYGATCWRLHKLEEQILYKEEIMQLWREVKMIKKIIKNPNNTWEYTKPIETKATITEKMQTDPNAQNFTLVVQELKVIFDNGLENYLKTG